MDTMLPFRPTFSLQEAADILGMKTTSSIRVDAASGRIKNARKEGGEWVIPYSYVLKRTIRQAIKRGFEPHAPHF